MALHRIRFCWRRFALLATMLLAIQAEAFAQEKVPEAAALEKAQKLVEELFADELAAAKTSAAKTGLAKEFIRQAVDTQDDPPGHYALLQAAGKLAIEAGDAETALAAVDRMGESFELSALAMKFKVLRAVAKKAKQSTQSKAVAQQALKLLDQAVEADEFSMAVELGKLGVRAARKARQQTLVKQLAARVKQAEKLAKVHTEYEQVMATLEKNPGDPDANLAAGRYLCLVKGDWEKGVSYLALGNDQELKQLAIKELNGVLNSKAQVALADAWWGLAQTREGREKDALMLRAGSWYEQAQESLQANLIKVKVEKRLEEIAKIGQPIPRTPGRPPRLAVAPLNEKKAKKLQEMWAEHLNLPVVMTNSIGMKLVVIPPGEFQMGSPDADPDAKSNEKPQHRVLITEPFCIGLCEVTQDQYRQVVGHNPSQFQAVGGTAPVDTVSWNHTQEFCRKLSERPKEKAAGRVYRLPTEAEWEYACRAGTITRHSFGNDPTRLAEYAWFRDNSADNTTHPVAQKKPNAWGLYDMHGNLWEWCSDWYGPYQQSPSDDPVGPSSGSKRVLRGKCWSNTPAKSLGSAFRYSHRPRRDVSGYGFRVAMTIKSK